MDNNSNLLTTQDYCNDFFTSVDYCNDGYSYGDISAAIMLANFKYALTQLTTKNFSNKIGES